MSVEEIVKQQKGTIVDVRTPSEFDGGHANGSVNIPLSEVPDRIEEIKKLRMPLVLCCASGNRSGQVQRYLSQLGIECYNAGPWGDVGYLQSKAN